MLIVAPDNTAIQFFYGSLPVIGAILLASWKDSKRLDAISKRIEGLDTSLNKRIEDSGVSLGKRIEGLDTSLNKRIDDSGGSLEKRIDDLSTSLGARIDDLRLEVREDMRDIKSRLTELERGSRLVQPRS